MKVAAEARSAIPAQATLERFLERLVARGLYTAVTGAVVTGDGLAWSGAAGFARAGHPADLDTVFDLASLSKPFTATLALRLHELGLLPLTLEVGEAWPESDPGLAHRNLGSLLRHRSRLLNWAPLYHRCRDRDQARELLLSGELVGAAPGTYSDLGYILWGMTAEKLLGAPLEGLLARHVLTPLGLAGIGTRPDHGERLARCTVDTTWEVRLAAAQGTVIECLPAPEVGTPQDGNTRFLGGFPGHAGLFGAARQVNCLGLEWLAPGRLLSPESVARALDGPRPYGLGWALRNTRGAGWPALSARSFGHTGFTGGSMWVDPAAGRVLLLLGHRASPLSILTPVRRRFNALAMKL